MMTGGVCGKKNFLFLEKDTVMQNCVSTSEPSRMWWSSGLRDVFCVVWERKAKGREKCQALKSHVGRWAMGGICTFCAASDSRGGACASAAREAPIYELVQLHGYYDQSEFTPRHPHTSSVAFPPTPIVVPTHAPEQGCVAEQRQQKQRATRHDG